MVNLNVPNFNDTLYNQRKMQFKQVRLVPNVVEHLSDISANYNEHINFNCCANITIFILFCRCKNIASKSNGYAANDIQIGKMPAAEYLWFFFI